MMVRRSGHAGHGGRRFRSARGWLPRWGAQGGSCHLPHGLLRGARDLLAIGAHIIGNGGAPTDGDVDGARQQHAQHVRHQIDVAVPGELVAQRPAGRHAADADIGQRQWLNRDAGMVRLVTQGMVHRSDQRGAERENPVAITRGAFREQHHGIAIAQAVAHLARDLSGLLAPFALDEDRTLKLGEPSEHRPAGDLVLGDKHHRCDRGDDNDVEPRDMVGQDQQRLVGRTLPDLLDANTDDGADGAMIQVGDDTL